MSTCLLEPSDIFVSDSDQFYCSDNNFLVSLDNIYTTYINSGSDQPIYTNTINTSNYSLIDNNQTITPSKENNNTTLISSEPVSIAQIIHLILATLVTIGWLKINNSTIDIVVTILCALISISTQIWARSRVTPIIK